MIKRVSSPHNSSSFSFLIAIVPLLEQYSFAFFPRLDLATIMIILFALFMVGKRKVSFGWKPTTVLVLWLFLGFFISSIARLSSFFSLEIAEGIVFLRLMKIIIVLFFVFAPNNYWSFDVYSCMNIVKWVIRINFLFLLIQQFFFFVFHTAISNPLLSVFTISGGGVMDNGYVVISNGLFRPSAFFLEPSWVTVYVAVYLIYVLFSRRVKYELRETIISALTILLTTSGLGLLVVLSVILCRFLSYHFSIRKLVFGIVMISFVLVLINISFVQNAIARLLNNRSVFSGRSGSGYKFFSQLPFPLRMVGCGFGYVPSGFLNGMEYLLITCGYWGTTTVLGCFLFMIKKTRFSWQKMVLLCWVVFLFGVQVFSVSTIVFYVSIGYSCIYNSKKRIQLYNRDCCVPRRIKDKI